MSAPNSLITAAGVSIGTLLLGIPIAIATIASANVYVPDIVLGTKDIDAGPSRTKTLTFGLLTAPTDAVLSAAYISIIASVLCAIGIALIHFFHNSKKGVIFGWTTLCLAATNLLGQLGCLAAWVVLQQKENARVPDTGAVQYVDGKYQTDGKMFTKEAWACTMEAYFSEREDWANKACDDLKKARGLTVALAFSAAIIIGLVYWQIREQGGLSWLLARRTRLQQEADNEDGLRLIQKR